MLLRTVVVLLVASALFVGVRGRRDFWDFEVYRTAGVRLLAGESLYRADDGHYQFKYWPTFAAAMIPFSLIPEEAGKFVWFVLSLVLLQIYMRRAIDALPDPRRSATWLFWFLLLVSAKFIVKELVNGQTNVPMGLLALAGAMAAERGRPYLAGSLVAAAVFVKPYALLLVPWLAVTAGAGALAAAGAGLLIGLLAPVVFYGWAGNVAQLRAWYGVVTDTTSPNLMLPENISFATMWAKWIGVGVMSTRLALATGVAFLALASFVWLRRRVVARPAFLEAGLLLLLMPLLSPQGWDYVLVLALPALVCLLDRLRDLTWPWRTVVLAGFALTSFTVFDLVGRRLYIDLMAVSAVTMGAMLLAVGLAHLRVRALA